jgi:hypothetical protein
LRSSEIGDHARANAGLYPPKAEGLRELVSSAEAVLALEPGHGEEGGLPDK